VYIDEGESCFQGITQFSNPDIIFGRRFNSLLCAKLASMSSDQFPNPIIPGLKVYVLTCDPFITHTSSFPSPNSDVKSRELRCASKRAKFQGLWFRRFNIQYMWLAHIRPESPRNATYTGTHDHPFEAISVFADVRSRRCCPSDIPGRSDSNLFILHRTHGRRNRARQVSFFFI